MKNMKLKNKRTLYSRILLIMLCVLMMISVSGCGTVAAGEGSNRAIGGDASVGTNSFFFKGTNGGHINTDKDDGSHKTTVFLFEPIGTNKIELKNAHKIGPGMGFFHTVALSLYRTVFDNDERLMDKIYTNEGVLHMSLTPMDVLTTTNEITTQAASQNVESGGTFATLRTACTGLAGGILVVIWAMGFINSIVSERFTMESALKGFMQLIMGMLVVLNAVEITCAFFNSGVSLVNSVTETPVSGSAFDAFQTECKNNIESVTGFAIGFDLGSIIPTIMFPVILIDFGAIIAILYLALPFFAMIKCAYQIVSAMITRMLEMMVRVLIAPIPIAMSTQTGFSSDVIRYFKHIMACALQPALMMIGIMCFDTIAEVLVKIFGGESATAASLEGFAAVIVITASYFILSTFLGTTKALANEVIAH